MTDTIIEKDTIHVTIGEDHSFNCSAVTIGRTGENSVSQLEIEIPKELASFDAFLEFKKPKGQTTRTTKLHVENSKIEYDIPQSLLDENGNIEVQLILQGDNGEIWKSATKKYVVLKSIDAGSTIPEEQKEDFFSEAQNTLNMLSTLSASAIVETASGSTVALKDVSPLEHEIKVKLSTEKTTTEICNLSEWGVSRKFASGEGEYTIASVEWGEEYQIAYFDDGESYCECWWDYETSYEPSVGDVLLYKEDNDWGSILYLVKGFSGDPTTVKVTVSSAYEYIYLGNSDNGYGTCYDSGETEFTVESVEVYDDGWGTIFFTNGTDCVAYLDGKTVQAGDKAVIENVWDEAIGDIPTLYLIKGEYREPTEHTPNADGTVTGIIGDGSSMTISNDKGAMLEVEYNVDTKKYIDKKLAQLVASAASEEGV